MTVVLVEVRESLVLIFGHTVCYRPENLGSCSAYLVAVSHSAKSFNVVDMPTKFQVINLNTSVFMVLPILRGRALVHHADRRSSILHTCIGAEVRYKDNLG